MNRDQNASFRSSGLFIPERTIFPVQKTWNEKNRARILDGDSVTKFLSDWTKNHVEFNES